MNRPVLLIEDDLELRNSLAQSLDLEDIPVISCGSFVAAKDHIQSSFPGVILSDMRMPGKDGFDVLTYARKVDRDLPVILLTGEADVPMAVRATTEGAYAFLQKPCPTSHLLQVLMRAQDHRAVVLRTRQLEQQQKSGDAAAVNFPGPSPLTTALREQLRQAAALPTNVYLHGPAGAGKRLAAHTIHVLAGEKRKFDGLTLDQMTSDEIESLPLPTMPMDLSVKSVDLASQKQQQALLNLISNHPKVRVIASGNKPLTKLRPDLLDDLFFALDTIKLEIPPLARRKQDLPVLFETLVRQSVRGLNANMPDIPETLTAQVINRTWPDNLPELRNFAHSFALGLNISSDKHIELTLSEQLDSFEKLILSETLKRKHGKAVEAAKALGLPRKTLYDKLSKYGLRPRDYRDPSI
jgi:two-component system C4-dicarboxylate transport response regulator DctD